MNLKHTLLIAGIGLILILISLTFKWPLNIAYVNPTVNPDNYNKPVTRISGEMSLTSFQKQFP